MPVDNIKKRALHKTAHHLDPTVWVGKNGITENVIKEIICALEDHELIKIKMLHSDKKNFEKNSLEKPIFLLENSSFLVFFDIPKNPDLGDVQIGAKHGKIDKKFKI